nr:transposase [Bradyrhizobium sp. 172]
MDSHKRSTQLERLEVVETGRRRRWSDDEKLRIVSESFEAPRAISSTARRHGISPVCSPTVSSEASAPPSRIRSVSPVRLLPTRSLRPPWPPVLASASWLVAPNVFSYLNSG